MMRCGATTASGEGTAEIQQLVISRAISGMQIK
jgi:hypothetical protein